MLHAFKIYTGPDNQTHVQEGTLDVAAQTEVITIHFKESPPHTSYDWHNAPVFQYVITLSGTLAFTTRIGEKFIIRPGDILVATDDIGTGHKWELIDDQPWRRVYVVLKPGAPDIFIPNNA
jgi:quercetin dioxygenase-like cupin family protein